MSYNSHTPARKIIIPGRKATFNSGPESDFQFRAGKRLSIPGRKANFNSGPESDFQFRAGKRLSIPGRKATFNGFQCHFTTGKPLKSREVNHNYFASGSSQIDWLWSCRHRLFLQCRNGRYFVVVAEASFSLSLEKQT